MKTRYCLGIESTAHTFGASIVRVEDDGSRTILSNARDMYSTESGGMVPAELSEHHVEVWPAVVSDALEEAGITMRDVDLVSYSRAPGIGHALRIGAGVARSLAARYDTALVGVNHCVAHLEIGRVLSGEEDPVLLYVSGANTQVIALEGGAYRVFGETVDIGVGNFLDTVARAMGLGFPGGPLIEELAASYDGELVELPYAVKGMDVSFSGVQTAVRTMVDQHKHSHAALAYAIQEHAFAMLVEVAERALAHTGKSSLVIGGGVGCNDRLVQMCELMCAERDVSFFAPDKQYLVDNGAMIALLGVRVFSSVGGVPVSETGIDPYERTDDVPVARQ